MTIDLVQCVSKRDNVLEASMAKKCTTSSALTEVTDRPYACWRRPKNDQSKALITLAQTSNHLRRRSDHYFAGDLT